MNAGPSHHDLLTAAAALRRRSIEDDSDGFRHELLHLKTLVIEHLLAEEGELADVADPTRALVEYGQRRLLTLIERLVFLAAGQDADSCPMLDSTTLAVALQRQARLEEALLPVAR